MPSYFCLSVTFLGDAFHGRRDDGVSEWPPSPLRAFQALVAAAAALWGEPRFSTEAVPALEWLAGLGPPDIVAPAGRTARLPYRLYVPNNAGDLVAKAWASGNVDASIAAHRTEKDVRPTTLVGGDVFKAGGNMVRFVWKLPTEPVPRAAGFIERLSEAARSITHLGWGIDMTAGHSSVLDDQAMAAISAGANLERWSPGPGGTPLRVPQPASDQGVGTLRALVHRQGKFTRRMSNDQPQDVPPLTEFDVIGYRRGTDPLPRPLAAFSVLKPDGSGFCPFGTVHNATVVAGMVRHALAELAKAQRPFGWTDDDIARIVLGHEPAGGAARLPGDAKRLAYLPLPSVERRGDTGEHIGSIRRVIVVGRPGMSEEIAWVRRALSGAELIAEETGELKALLSMIPHNDRAVRRYVDPSSAWTTVTPVVIPGYDDGREAKADRLLRKALEQAGVSPEMARDAKLEWRGVGFFPGVELASRYRRPRNASEAPVRHVKVRWRDSQGSPISVPGPLAVGSGRFRGLGLFLPVAE